MVCSAFRNHPSDIACDARVAQQLAAASRPNTIRGASQPSSGGPQGKLGAGQAKAIMLRKIRNRKLNGEEIQAARQVAAHREASEQAKSVLQQLAKKATMRVMLRQDGELKVINAKKVRHYVSKGDVATLEQIEMLEVRRIGQIVDAVEDAADPDASYSNLLVMEIPSLRI